MKWKVINWLETTKHKLWVAWYLIKTCHALLWRALVHDLSKYGQEEAPYFERALPGCAAWNTARKPTRSRLPRWGRRLSIITE